MGMGKSILFYVALIQSGLVFAQTDALSVLAVAGGGLPNLASGFTDANTMLSGGLGEQPVPVVNELLGSEAFNQVLSGGVPGLDLLLDNPAAAGFTPVAGQLLNSVSVADLLVGAAAAAP